MSRTRIATIRRGVAAILVSLAAAACSTTNPANATEHVDPPPMTSAADLAARLHLVRHVMDDSGKLALTAYDGDAILLFPETTVATVHGSQFSMSVPIELRGNDAWISANDASAIESLWLNAVVREPVGPPLPPPLPSTPRVAPRPAATGPYGDQPTASETRSWSVPLTRQWTHIVIHHSATDAGNAASMDAFHRNVKHWDGLGYDFVIGNGNGSGDGTIEVGYRWREQKRGAHAGADAPYFNEHGVGICLVGDFTKARPTAAQMRALSRLCNFLSSYCGIPLSNYRLHGDIRKTECPGPLFPRDFLTATRLFSTAALDDPTFDQATK
jgi:hypothetical protein